jgi:hypothetical protein
MLTKCPVPDPRCARVLGGFYLLTRTPSLFYSDPFFTALLRRFLASSSSLLPATTVSLSLTHSSFFILLPLRLRCPESREERPRGNWLIFSVVGYSWDTCVLSYTDLQWTKNKISVTFAPPRLPMDFPSGLFNAQLPFHYQIVGSAIYSWHRTTFFLVIN